MDPWHGRDVGQVPCNSTYQSGVFVKEGLVYVHPMTSTYGSPSVRIECFIEIINRSNLQPSCRIVSKNLAAYRKDQRSSPQSFGVQQSSPSPSQAQLGFIGQKEGSLHPAQNNLKFSAPHTIHVSGWVAQTHLASGLSYFIFASDKLHSNQVECR